MGSLIQRDDETKTFVRIDTRQTVVWAARKDGWLWHATSDGIHAVCRSDVIVDLDHDPFPSTVDRSDDLMTCVRCQERVAVRKKAMSLCEWNPYLLKPSQDPARATDCGQTRTLERRQRQAQHPPVRQLREVAVFSVPARPKAHRARAYRRRNTSRLTTGATAWGADERPGRFTYRDRLSQGVDRPGRSAAPLEQPALRLSVRAQAHELAQGAASGGPHPEADRTVRCECGILHTQ